MTELEKLQTEMDVLLQLNHMIAYTGSLDKIETRSYVLYADVIKLISKRRKKIKQLKKQNL